MLFLLVSPIIYFGWSIDAHHSCAFASVLMGIGLISFDPATRFSFDWKFHLPILLLLISFGVLPQSDNEDILLCSGLLIALCIKPSLPKIALWLHVAWLVFGVLLTALLIANISAMGYTHESTYRIQPFFAHRNIALESFAFLSLAAMKANSRKGFYYLSAALLLSLLFQSRAAMLVSAAGLLLFYGQAVWNRKNVRFALLGLISAYAIFQLYLYLLPWDAYKEIFDRLPDVMKSVEARYNLSNATSSSERLAIWDWSINNSQLIGHGLGSWKFMAQTHVNEAIGKYNVIVRRPHSDLIRIIFELGWLPALALVYLIANRFRHCWKELCVIAPAFLLSFPMERFEHISMLFLIAFIGEENRKTNMQNSVLRRRIIRSATLLLLIISCLWITSQHIYGKLLRGSRNLKHTTTTERFILEVFNHDPALNRLITFQLIELHNRGNTKAFQQLLNAVPKNLQNEIWFRNIVVEIENLK